MGVKCEITELYSPCCRAITYRWVVFQSKCPIHNQAHHFPLKGSAFPQPGSLLRASLSHSYVIVLPSSSPVLMSPAKGLWYNLYGPTHFCNDFTLIFRTYRQWLLPRVSHTWPLQLSSFPDSMGCSLRLCLLYAALPEETSVPVYCSLCTHTALLLPTHSRYSNDGSCARARFPARVNTV